MQQQHSAKVYSMLNATGNPLLGNAQLVLYLTYEWMKKTVSNKSHRLSELLLNGPREENDNNNNNKRVVTH